MSRTLNARRLIALEKRSEHQVAPADWLAFVAACDAFFDAPETGENPGPSRGLFGFPTSPLTLAHEAQVIGAALGETGGRP